MDSKKLSWAELVFLLKERAIEFMKLAEEALRDGRYDVACALFEQAFQLYLKYMLLRFYSIRVKSHDLRELIGILALKTGNERLADFAKRNRSELILLEESYYVGRYGEYEFEEEEGRACERVTKRAFELLHEIERSLED
ncbi:DNA-binding protein [Ignicoccus pacificus DSM 13166]|uniref:DNA-binding protein n=1 Tax=Ignicoccus pacificus DSM 13166 TaxID=940294 RepID=A0A977KAF8_9CREN|nr:DNA-binding protein [Ignicoccus pacificus DSM 13166]